LSAHRRRKFNPNKALRQTGLDSKI
jgi:hypothetical protein